MLPAPLLTVAERLGADLRSQVVFVGGIVQSLLISDPAAGPPRPTDDVDLVIAVDSLSALYALGGELRSRGFSEDSEPGAPICRWVVDGVRADVMPSDPTLLGFSNVWYASALEHATVTRSGSLEIRFVDAPHFCATKLEAFGSRGEDDYYHHDLEDVLKLVDSRPELVDEIASAPDDVREFIATEVTRLLALDRFLESLPGHLEGDAAGQGRLPLLRRRLDALAALRGRAEAPPATSALTPVRPARPTPVIRPSKAPARAAIASRANVTMVDLRSSNLRAAGYDASSETLIIAFRTGSTYEYYGVPSAAFTGLLGAYSHGRYHHLWIRSRYRYTRIA